jgi:hypothetical protein
LAKWCSFRLIRRTDLSNTTPLLFAEGVSKFMDLRPSLFEFHISGSSVTELFRLGFSPVADSLNFALVRAGKHLEDESDTAGLAGFQS